MRGLARDVGFAARNRTRARRVQGQGAGSVFVRWPRVPDASGCGRDGRARAPAIRDGAELKKAIETAMPGHELLFPEAVVSKNNQMKFPVSLMNKDTEKMDVSFTLQVSAGDQKAGSLNEDKRFLPQPAE